MKSILITGCSSGIGLDAAQMLRSNGWRVFASCRKAEDCARLKAMGFESPQLDYEDPASIARAVDEVTQATGGTLDALFNNGAYAIPGAVEDLPPEALTQIFQANLIGWHDLTRRIIPIMRAQGHGRIVNCSSVLGFVGLRWRGAYVASKYALEGLTDVLRIEMRDTPIKVSLIEPGPITTKIRVNSIPHFERWIDWQSSARMAQYRDELCKRLYEPSGAPDTFELAPRAVSRKLLHALESPRPKARYYVTGATHIMGALRRILPTSMLDWVIAKR